MRTRSQIKQKLKQATYRHLQKQLRANFKKKPSTCGHNRGVVLDEESGEEVRLCGYTNERGIPRNVVCDSRVPGCNAMARDCPLWTPCQTKEEIKDEFQAVVRSNDRGVIASEYPDLAALIWVLDEPQGKVEDEIEDLDEQEEVGGAEKPPWWIRVFKRGQ